MCIFAYEVMPNHWHLILSPRKDGDLGLFMHHLTNKHTRQVHTSTGTVGSGHLYQGRYKSFPVQTDEYFLTVARYIERNPLRAKLVQDAKDYPHSSYNYYAYGKNDPLVDEDPYYVELGQDGQERQEKYREFVKLDGPYDRVIDQSLTEAYF